MAFFFVLCPLASGWAGDVIKQEIVYRVVTSFPHAPQAFTQGLYYEKGFFYESTGLYGQSSLRMVEARTGRIKRKVALPDEWFGEGITVLGDRLIQLTWRTGIGIVYDKKTFRRRKMFHYPHEGWGITHDGHRLLVSDGTEVIRFWHPTDFREMGRLRVMEGGKPVYGLNELEFIEGSIYANVWPTARIIRINPVSGQVTGEMDLSGLIATFEKKDVDVANGIAYDPISRLVFITGKFWPRVFVIRIEHSELRESRR